MTVDVSACERERLGPTGCLVSDRPKVINQFRMLTAREMIMTAMTSEIADCASISILAERVRGKCRWG